MTKLILIKNYKFKETIVFKYSLTEQLTKYYLIYPTIQYSIAKMRLVLNKQCFILYG